jgi:mono/diheme cytochrome c family protein
MNLGSHRRVVGSLFALTLLASVIAGCAPDANAEIISPQLGTQLYAKEASAEVAVAPTAEPLRITNLSPEEITAGLPEDFAAALASADPSAGEVVALSNACIGCHALDPAQQMTGPTWYHLGDTAANRVAGQSPALYVYTSIVQPNEYVVPDYPSGVMPQMYGTSIAQDDLADLVAYLLAQHE